MLKLHHEMCLELFEEMINAGVCREQARGILPQNMYTEYYGTANLSNIIETLWPVAVSNYRKNIAQ